MDININKYTHIIWDFNGTILDDVGIGIESVNVLLTERGIPTIDSVERYQKVFGFPIIEYYERIGFDFSKESYDDVAVLWVNEYNSRRTKAPIQAGVKKLLDKFRLDGVEQCILSASEKSMLHRQLDELGVLGYFNEIYGLDNIKAGGKTHIAISWLKAHPDAKPLIIGDTDHDLDVARAIGADCVLVSCGHQSFDSLLARHDLVFHDMEELFAIVSK